MTAVVFDQEGKGRDRLGHRSDPEHFPTAQRRATVDSLEAVAFVEDLFSVLIDDDVRTGKFAVFDPCNLRGTDVGLETVRVKQIGRFVDLGRSTSRHHETDSGDKGVFRHIHRLLFPLFHQRH